MPSKPELLRDAHYYSTMHSEDIGRQEIVEIQCLLHQMKAALEAADKEREVIKQKEIDNAE